MLRAIFYARFHTERGPSIVHQYPIGSVLGGSETPLISWSDISAYVIPPYDLCNRALSISTNGHRVLGFPVSLEDSKYDRNRFTFNVCFVLGEDEDALPWERVVRKTARFLVALEEEDGLLQREENLAGLKWAGELGYPAEDVGTIHALLRGIMDDMKEYGETCVRVDKVHVLNLRLEPLPRAPPKVCAWDVPLLIRPLPPPAEWTWDLTLLRIHPYIDGIRHVQRIAELADAEVKLVKRAVHELVLHGHALLLDIFHFQAIYTCTRTITTLLADETLQDECRHYIALPTADPLPTRQAVRDLYPLLHPGQRLADFCLAHAARLAHIDVRRLITFGTIKGLLRRVHKYILALDPAPALPRPSAAGAAGTASPASKPRSNDELVRAFERAWRRAALSSGWATPPAGPPPLLVGSLGEGGRSAEERRVERTERLRGYLDGRHCLDQICVEMHLSERKVMEMVRAGRVGECVVLNR